MLCHDSFKNQFEINFVLQQDFGLSLTELENMIPYEREVYILMIMKRVKKQQEEAQQARRG